MRYHVVGMMVLLVMSVMGRLAYARDCQQFVVTAADGYANVRATPRLAARNIVAALPSGMHLTVGQQQAGWLYLASPVPGWIAATQLSRVPCDAVPGKVLETGIATIERFGKRAAAGQRQAAETFLRMSRGVDGALAEAYAEASVHWVAQRPSFFLDVLTGQAPSVQHAALEALNVGLGSRPSPARQRFEAALRQWPETTPVVQAWRRMTQPGQAPNPERP